MTTALRVHRALLDALGPQQWWPGAPFEVMVGAVLVQHTAWKNVERAIANLRDAGALEPHRLAALPPAELEELIRPAGYFRLKAKRLRNLVAMVVDRYDGSLEAMRAADSWRLREELLGVNGIGPETADSILLYALDKPVVVVDAYTHRIWARHGWIDYDSDYHRLQEQVAGDLPDEAPLLNELHAQLVYVGQHYCKRAAKCGACPLRDLLPEGGMVEP